LTWSFIKTAIFFSLILSFAFIMNFIKGIDGFVIINLLSREYRFSIISFVILIIIFLIFFSIFGVLFRLVTAVYKFIRGDENALRRFFEKRYEKKGFTSLINAFSSNFEGDYKKSLLEIKRSKKYLKNKSLPDILSLSSYEALGNISEQKKIFESFLKDKNTMSMGLFGLIKIKLSEGDTGLALKLTKKLIGLKPKNVSFQKTFLKLQLMEEDWSGAHKTFLDLQKLEPTEKAVRNRDEGTHLYLIAKKLREEGKIEEAMQKAKIAFKRTPGLIPNSLLLADMEMVKGRKAKAENVLISTWKSLPHPEIAKKFAEVETNETPSDRVERFNKILNFKKSDIETKTLKAELNILLENFPEARRSISDITDKNQANSKIYTLMAAIEKGSGSEDSVVKGWLAKAVTAKRSKRWVCSNCKSQGNWEAVCKKCNSFSTMEWIDPVEDIEQNNDQTEILPLILGKGSLGEDITMDKENLDDK